MAEERPNTSVEEAKLRIREMQENRDQNRAPVAPVEKDIKPTKAKPKKKKFGQKMKEAMFSEDIGNGSVTEYVFFKVAIPAVKRVLSEMANTAINMALGLDPKTRTVTATHTANASVYRDRNYSRSTGDGNYGTRREAVSEFEWEEADARDIYTQCIDILDRYPSLSLAEVYSIMNMPEKIRATDKHWGWTSSRSIDLVENYGRGTFSVVFQPVKPI